MRFADLLALLGDTKNEFLLLEGTRGDRKVVCAPGLVGRVMSSTFDARNGQALGWIGTKAIQDGAVDPTFNNFGGEERLWFGPEGGQFGLHFAGWPQNMTNYRVPPCASSLAYQVTAISQDRSFLVMEADVSMTNLAHTTFKLHVKRIIHVLTTCPYLLDCENRTEAIGFQSETLVTNISDKMIEPESGLICCWTLGQFPNANGRVVAVPFQTGNVTQLGEPVRFDYCKDLCVGGLFPSERWRLGRNHALFLSDGKCRTKIAVSPLRATGRLGSVDFDAGELLINDFDVFPELPYAASYWKHLSSEEILDGEALSCYIDGPDENGGRAGDCYELETLSPALSLRPGDTFLHRNRVTHIRGPRKSIEAIALRFLHTNIAEVTQAAGAAVREGP